MRTSEPTPDAASESANFVDSCSEEYSAQKPISIEGTSRSMTRVGRSGWSSSSTPAWLWA